MKRITQSLKWLVTLLAMIVCTGAWAQEVSYDFTGSDWTVSNGTLSNGTVSFTGDGAANFKMNTGYFMMGKSGAYINFPTYTFDVEKIEVVGRSEASGSTIMNVFVGDQAVSTATTGCTGTNTYVIASDYQAAGTQYTLKVTSGHNAQITAIKIYKASGVVTTITISDEKLTNKDIYAGTNAGKLIATVKEGDTTIDNPSITWTSSNTSVATVGAMGAVTLVAAGTTTITAAYNGYTAEYELVVTNSAPVVDYAELPFEFNSGRDAIANINGLTQSGLGTDYSSAPNSKLKFDGTGDWVVLKINERPGTLTFNITNNSFSGGTFTVQTSEDGESYTDLNKYTSISGTQTETFNNLGENVRYIKWIYTTKSSGNVGLGNISLTKYEEQAPSIIVSSTAINVPASKTNDGFIEVSYTKIDSKYIVLFEADGETPKQDYDWLAAVINPDGNILFTVNENVGEARTAYFKVKGLVEGSNNEIYSELITITQAAAPQAYTLSVTPNDNAEIFVFYNDPENNWPDIQSGDEVLASSSVMISVSADEGYQVDGVTVTDENGQEVSLTEEEEGISWTFTMPESDVTVSCTVKEFVPAEEFKFVKVTSNDELTNGEYLIVYEDGSVAFDGGLETLDAPFNTIGVTISDNDEIEGNETTGAATFTIDVANGSIKSASGYYIGVNSNSNGLKVSSDATTYKNTFTIDDDENVVIAADFTGSKMKLLFNTGKNDRRFRYYQATNSTNHIIQLYKKVVEEPMTLGLYLSKHPSHTGIRIVRIQK